MHKFVHVCIVAKDAVKSGKFYTDILKCEHMETKDEVDKKFVYVNAGGTTIELIEYKNVDYIDRVKGPVDHIAFLVGDIYKEVNWLKESGVKFIFDEPKELADKIIFFFEGPDGERIEYIQMK